MTKQISPLESSREIYLSHRIPRQSKFQVFRGIESGTGNLTYFEWLKMRHLSSGELVKHELKCGAIGDT